jgi:ABC-2 type transport system permease protein
LRAGQAPENSYGRIGSMTTIDTVPAAGASMVTDRRPGPRRKRISAAAKDLASGFGLFELWMFLGWRDLRKHYSRSVLGPLWLTASMGVMILSLGILYSKIFKMEIDQYLPFLAIGFIIWSLVSGSLTGACHVYSSAAGFVRQMRLPLSTFAYKFVWTQLITFLHNFAIYVFVAIVFSISPGWQALLVIPAIAVISLNAFFAALILGPLCARFRDIPMIVASLVQVAFFLTPIIWHADQLSDRAALVQWNPFYHFIEIVRDPLLGDTIRAGNWIAVGAVTIVHGLLAFAFFSRFRSRIAYWA